MVAGERPARVQRVDGPAPRVLCLSLFLPGAEVPKRVLLLDDRGPHQADERVKGRAADAFVKRLRNLIGGAHLLAIERQGNSTRLHLQTRDGSVYLWIEEGLLTLRDDAGRPLACRRRIRERPWQGSWAQTAVTPEHLDALPTYEPNQSLSAQVALRLIRRQEKRVERTLRKVAQERARAEQAPALRHDADLLMAHLHVPSQDGVVEVQDWLRPDAPRTIPLARDARRSGPNNTTWRTAHETAKGLYDRAKRFERGAAHATRRLQQLEEQATNLRALRALIADGEVPDASLEAHLEGHGIRLPSTADQGRVRQERLPYRRFAHPAGRILVGRSARDNDQLTLRIARPGDLWLHARGTSGSHVIVPQTRQQTATAELRLDAAMLAAHFSSSKGDEQVDVLCVERRHVRKPRGAAAGSVTVRNERTIRVRMNPHRIRELLSMEVR